jgi:hypothetical protein
MQKAPKPFWGAAAAAGANRLPAVKAVVLGSLQKYRGEPMTALVAPAGENLLLLAHRAIADKQAPDAAELAAEFHRHFVVTVPPPAGTPPVFERFSLVDPGIRTVIRANTAAV